MEAARRRHPRRARKACTECTHGEVEHRQLRGGIYDCICPEECARCLVRCCLGGRLAATTFIPQQPGASMTSATSHLRININVADAIDFCDSVLAASMTVGAPDDDFGPDARSSSPSAFTGIPYQRGTLHPLRLRKDAFRRLRVEFDVINTSNLADHLGEKLTTTNNSYIPIDTSSK